MSWVARAWACALQTNREAVIGKLPEDIWWEASEEGRGISLVDTYFIATLALTKSESCSEDVQVMPVDTLEAIAAVRLLGILAEESYCPESVAGDVLGITKNSLNPLVSYYSQRAIERAGLLI